MCGVRHTLCALKGFAQNAVRRGQVSEPCAGVRHTLCALKELAQNAVRRGQVLAHLASAPRPLRFKGSRSAWLLAARKKFNEAEFMQ